MLVCSVQLISVLDSQSKFQMLTLLPAAIWLVCSVTQSKIKIITIQ